MHNLSKSPKPKGSCSVTFLIKENKVLLGKKKSGIGRGFYVGIGGKLEKGESPEQAAVREFEEETGVKIPIKNLTKMAVINFYFPKEQSKMDQQVNAFVVSKWEGEPKETEEITPIWFDKDNLPFAQMWDDAKLWIPDILEGKMIEMNMLYSKDLKVVDTFNLQ